jgi:hypothetical protein
MGIEARPPLAIITRQAGKAKTSKSRLRWWIVSVWGGAVFKRLLSLLLEPSNSQLEIVARANAEKN